MRRTAIGACAAGLALGLGAPASAAPGDPARPGATTVQRAADLPAFGSAILRLGPARRRAMTPSAWRPGCPVALDDLRVVRARHVTFAGGSAVGELVVHRSVAAGVVRALRRLYAAGFPIRRMVGVERYGGDDFASIEADNTSAFNCRAVTGGTRFSEHSYGRAIDLDPLENPYVYRGGTTSHRRSRPYLDRRDVRPGMLVRSGIAVRAFREAGWRWGGEWTGPVDLQHLSSTGR